MSPTNAQLRQFMVDYFGPEELDTLCFDHFPDFHQNLGDGVKPNQLAKEIILFCDRRGRRNELLAVLEQERPSRWRETFGETANSSDEPSVPKNSGIEISGYELEIREINGEPRLIAKRVSPSPLLSAGKGDRYTHPKTDIELICIPAGPFQYGEQGKTKTIELPEFWIGRYPVTNAQYKRFLDANSEHRVPSDWDEASRSFPNGEADHPVVNVSWHDATYFCVWAGLRLPTEQEWEKAARGDDGRLFPWGDEQPAMDRCNFNLDARGVSRVGTYSPSGDSPYGCVDMAGNVWEWTSTECDPRYANDSYALVLKGGCYGSEGIELRCAEWIWGEPDTSTTLYGFRVASSI